MARMARISFPPRSVSAYSTLGGVVANTVRESMPRPSKSFSRALSTLAEIAGIARRSSVKRRCPSLRFQMISGVQTPPSKLIQADIGQPGGGGTFFLELHKAFGPLSNPALAPEAREAAVANIGRKLDVLEQVLNDARPYLAGPEFSVAGGYLFVVLSWQPKLGVNLAPWPALGQFSGRVATRPAVQAALAAERLPQAA